MNDAFKLTKWRVFLIYVVVVIGIYLYRLFTGSWNYALTHPIMINSYFNDFVKYIFYFLIIYLIISISFHFKKWTYAIMLISFLVLHFLFLVWASIVAGPM